MYKYEIPDENEDLLKECKVRTFSISKDSHKHDGIRLVHVPTNIQVVSRNLGSRDKNKEQALIILRSKLTDLIDGAEIYCKDSTRVNSKRINSIRKQKRKRIKF